MTWQSYVPPSGKQSGSVCFSPQTPRSLSLIYEAGTAMAFGSPLLKFPNDLVRGKESQAVFG